jgi:hypothetical protein
LVFFLPLKTIWWSLGHFVFPLKDHLVATMCFQN